MKITIDNKEYEVGPRNKTVLDVCRKHKLSITAPCYKTLRQFGTCNSCLVEVDGEKKLSCGIPPDENEKYVLQRDDLLEERKEKVKIFKSHKEKMERLLGKS
ncbi:2Fe-2S iron-sulfur cluster-binding protein [Flammeovirga agarivorans]|uniref:2Fe-2S iron-sulfur cluster binding domain-containing protein n=1 Tax=Flammeovirga agarivorans TaxID=2726742 RepID=A0A7X8SP64_9BACT|nr:2Fe-2S iron-sulfur cluster-binding protein [Flammeovirga agarivorans]NLR93745.1 2Fe-2S iron-sulfur cluster binding domain-containing protein [Flammeovirga agarivorans]